MSRAERMAVAAAIKAGKLAEGIPEDLPDIAHMTADETLGVVKALKVCTVLPHLAAGRSTARPRQAGRQGEGVKVCSYLSSGQEAARCR